MKPGQIADRKTRSAAKLAHAKLAHAKLAQRLAAAAVLLSWMLATLACSGEFVTPAQLTATNAEQSAVAGHSNQVSAVGGGGAVDLTPAPTEPALPELTETPIPVPTATQLAPSATPQTLTLNPQTTQDPPILYYTQAGDTLKALASRFNVQPEEITSPEPIPQEGLFNPGVLLLIPPRLGETSSSTPLIPDSEVVYSPSALDFDITAFVNDANGYLKSYREWRASGWFDGPGVIKRVAIENSINPRILLAVLDQQSHWVYSQPQSLAETDYPIGWLHFENEKKGLYYQLSWMVQQLNIGYYGWRDGGVTEITFKDGKTLRLAPDLNAGTVALLYMFSKLYNQQEWAGILYGPDGLMVHYESMFGSPWLRAQSVEPLFPATLTQPPLTLPFLPGHTWSYTGGPHSAWGPDGADAALDFAPSTDTHGCYKAVDWVAASAPGLVVRSENGVVVIDLDGDGYEQTGWALMYLHIATDGRAPVGEWLDQNDKVGYPSCEGGASTGTHTHFARKYNGEWILADGPMPFVLSGWRARAGNADYLGLLTQGDQTVYSSTVGSFESRVSRPIE